MCVDCSHAGKCQDLLNLLKVYSFEEKMKEPDYLATFPFTQLPPPGAQVDPKNKLNQLTSGEWLKFSRTVISEAFPKILGHKLRRQHPDAKSPFLLGQLIAFFTKKGDLVLDPFAGTGSALIAASLLGREAVGFELHKRWIDLYYEICKQNELPKQKLVQGDSIHLTRYLPPESVDFILVDPPNITNPEEWMGPESEGEPLIDAFFTMFEELLLHSQKILRSQKYVAVFTHNLYQNGNYIYLTPHYAEAAEKSGYLFKGEKIWENKAEKLRPYGYPHTYVPNIVHYSILFFQKRV